MNIIEARSIVKTFGNYAALNCIDLNIPEGSIFGLLGPNGAGKTTLLRIINQIYAPDSGSLCFKGNAMKADDAFRIGYLPEERGLYKKMKVGEQALYLARLKGLSRHDAQVRLKFWFDKFEIGSWWNKKVEELSKGMAQKVQFIITVLHNPELYIFDEPFSGFDPINATLLRDEILELRNNGATIIFSTHNMNSVEELCDHLMLINKGLNILEGNVEEIKNRYKNGIYEVSYTGAILNNIPDSLSVVEHATKDNFNLLKFKVKNNNEPNEVLKQFLPFIQIRSFNEIRPSMNDIFIETVAKSGKVLE